MVLGAKGSCKIVGESQYCGFGRGFEKARVHWLVGVNPGTQRREEEGVVKKSVDSQ